MAKVVDSEEQFPTHFVLLIRKPFMNLSYIIHVTIENESAHKED